MREMRNVVAWKMTAKFRYFPSYLVSDFIIITKFRISYEEAADYLLYFIITSTLTLLLGPLAWVNWRSTVLS